jgi:hemerythrin-like domain-containing protein
MVQVVRAVRAAATGTGGAGDARAMVAGMTLGANFRALGSFCGQYCAVVDVHHRIEDAALFPDLRAADPDLGPVLDRLSVEHVAVHEVLVDLDRALVAMVEADGERLPAVQDAVQRLSDALLDHLAYEEAELLPALGRLGLRV